MSLAGKDVARHALSLAVAAGSLCSLVQAATSSVWDGNGGDALWTTAANWGGNAPTPGAAYTLEFGGTVQLAPSNDFAAASQFGSLTFASGAGAFTLSGNSLTLNGSIVNNSANRQTIGLNLILNGTRTVNAASGDVEITGGISRDGSTQRALIKEGAGTLTLSGINTFGGTSTTGTVTTINGGAMVLNAASVAGSSHALNGAVTVNNGGTLKLAGTGGDQIKGGNTAYVVTVNAGATLDMNGRNEGLRSLALASDGVVTNSAASTVSTLSLVEHQASLLAGRLTDGAGVLALDLYQNTKTLSGDNTYSGGTTVSGSTVVALGSNTALGTGALTFTAGSIARSNSDSARSLANNVSAVNGTTFGSAVAGESGDLSFGGLTHGGSGLNVANARTTFTSLLVPSNGLTKGGAGALLISGGGTVSGTLTLGSGMVGIAGTAALNGAVVFGNASSSGGVLGLNGVFGRSLGGTTTNVTWTSGKDGGFAAYGGDLTVALGGTASPASLTWAGDGSTNRFVSSGSKLLLGHAFSDGTVTFQNGINLNGVSQTLQVEDGLAAVDARLTGVLSNGGLTKTGEGTLEVAATNSYLGLTTVNAGRLLLSGTLSGDVLVATGAALSGSGSVLGAVTVRSGGTLAPGSSPGNFNAGNGLILAGTLAWEHNAGNALGVGGVSIAGFDTLTITHGDVDLTGGDIDLAFADATDFSSSFWDAGHSWVILNNSGTGSLIGTLAIGTIAGYAGPSPAGQGSFSTATVGNDLVLTWTVIPEPTTVGAMAAGMLAMLSRRRRS